MELESYFDFIHEDVIRIKGHRIDIEIGWKIIYRARARKKFCYAIPP